MVPIGDGSYSRELCGGTHVPLDGREIGVSKLSGESSSGRHFRRSSR